MAEEIKETEIKGGNNQKHGAKNATVTKVIDREKDIEYSEKVKNIITEVEGLSVMELSNLVKALEEKFGVSAQPQLVAGVSVGPQSGQAPTVAEEEKTSFDVILTNIGDKKIQIIKEIRAITNLGLKEAKDLVEQAPKPVKHGIPKNEAEEIKKKLEAAGAKVEIK